jgi:mono/diheme cytochrome c family protein
MRHVLRRAAALVLAGPLTACAQPAPADGAPDEGAARLRNDCAACHGAQRGRDGQKKPVLSRLTPDLTGLAARNSGEFPTDSVARVSDGRGFEMLAHGSLDVPVWGALERRSQVANAQARVECRVEAPAE